MFCRVVLLLLLLLRLEVFLRGLRQRSLVLGMVELLLMSLVNASWLGGRRHRSWEGEPMERMLWDNTLVRAWEKREGERSTGVELSCRFTRSHSYLHLTNAVRGSRRRRRRRGGGGVLSVVSTVVVVGVSVDVVAAAAGNQGGKGSRSDGPAILDNARWWMVRKGKRKVVGDRGGGWCWWRGSLDGASGFVL